MSKQINTRIQYKYDSPTNWKNCDKKSLAGELYVEGPLSEDDEDQGIRLRIGDGMHNINTLPLVGGSKKDPDPELVVDVPCVSTPEDIIYDQAEWNLADLLDNYDDDYMTISGTVTATSAGTYTAYAQFKPTTEVNYVWRYPNGDTSSEPVKIDWEVKKAKDPIDCGTSKILSADLDFITEPIYIAEPETAIVTITPEITSFELSIDYEAGDYPYLLFSMGRLDDVDYSERYVVEATVTIERLNYETEVLNLTLTVEPSYSHYWNVYAPKYTYKLIYREPVKWGACIMVWQDDDNPNTTFTPTWEYLTVDEKNAWPTSSDEDHNSYCDGWVTSGSPEGIGDWSHDSQPVFRQPIEEAKITEIAEYVTAVKDDYYVSSTGWFNNEDETNNTAELISTENSYSTSGTYMGDGMNQQVLYVPEETVGSNDSDAFPDNGLKEYEGHTYWFVKGQSVD